MIKNAIQKRKENNQKLQHKYNKSFTFTPKITKTNIKTRNSKKISKNNSIKTNITEQKELTPIKYVNHKYDYVTSIYKNDGNLLKRIKEQNEKKIKKYEKIKIENDNEKLEECTFKPDMSKTFNKNLSFNKTYKKSNTNNINDKNKDNKSFTYVDFYQHKKNKGNSKTKNKLNKTNKSHIEDKKKDIEKIGSLTPIIISKKIKKTNTSNKNNENDSFSIIHKLILDNKP